jgi:hypothetical protein
MNGKPISRNQNVSCRCVTGAEAAHSIYSVQATMLATEAQFLAAVGGCLFTTMSSPGLCFQTSYPMDDGESFTGNTAADPQSWQPTSVYKMLSPPGVLLSVKHEDVWLLEQL